MLPPSSSDVIVGDTVGTSVGVVIVGVIVGITVGVIVGTVPSVEVRRDEVLVVGSSVGVVSKLDVPPPPRSEASNKVLVLIPGVAIDVVVVGSKSDPVREGVTGKGGGTG